LTLALDTTHVDACTHRTRAPDTRTGMHAHGGTQAAELCGESTGGGTTAKQHGERRVKL